MESWVYQKGKGTGLQEGIEKGLKPTLRLYERRLGRALTGEEHATLRQRLDTLGLDRLLDVALDLAADALAGWLHDPAAT